MSNLDRFSWPLQVERPSLLDLEEQNELNKKHMVMDYVSLHWDVYSLVPSVEQVQEHYFKIDLDSDVVKSIIEEF